MNGPTEWTPKKPEYLIARLIAPYLQGVPPTSYNWVYNSYN